jgi:hypothetical protein
VKGRDGEGAKRAGCGGVASRVEQRGRNEWGRLLHREIGGGRGCGLSGRVLRLSGAHWWEIFAGKMLVVFTFEIQVPYKMQLHSLLISFKRFTLHLLVQKELHDGTY